MFWMTALHLTLVAPYFRWQNQQCGCAPSEDSDQPGHPPSLIRVSAVRMKKGWILSYPLKAQRRLWSDWADAQVDLSLRCAHSHFVDFVMRRLIYTVVCAIITMSTMYRSKAVIYENLIKTNTLYNWLQWGWHKDLSTRKQWYSQRPEAKVNTAFKGWWIFMSAEVYVAGEEWRPWFISLQSPDMRPLQRERFSYQILAKSPRPWGLYGLYFIQEIY